MRRAEAFEGTRTYVNKVEATGSLHAGPVSAEVQSGWHYLHTSLYTLDFTSHIAIIVRTLLDPIAVHDRISLFSSEGMSYEYGI